MSIFIPPKINDEQLSKIILEKGQIVFNESDNKFYTGNGEVGGEKINKDAPTKTSELVNDSGFITVDEIPPVQIEESDPIYIADKPNLALKSELFSKDYNDLTNKPSIPSKTSELTNDSGFITANDIPSIEVTETDPIYTADKPNLALKSEIPTKVSQLSNDSGFISSIPQNLVTEQELNNKGYLTSFTQSDPVYSKDKPNLALKSELFSKSYNDLTDKPFIPSVQGLATEKYVDDKVSAVKVPSKTSELTNDSGFITADDIPSVEVTETDPVYTADKPNLALKSELFSKSYNDLTDKPELYQPKADGDGSKFLADDGTYKTVQGGGSAGGSVDLSNYTGNINFKYDSGNSYLKTSDKTFTLGTQAKNYVSQMNSGSINGGNLLTITTDYFRIMDAKAYNTLFYIDNYGNARAMSSIDSPNVRVNGVNVAVGQNQVIYYDQNLSIQPDNNQFYYPVYTDFNWSEGIFSLELNIYQNVDNFTLIFKTAANFVSYTINMYAENFLINKPFNFESNKKYIICIDKNIIFWSEIQDYVAEVQE